MLLIKTKVKPSRIPEAGLGVYTKSYIQEGQIVWKYSHDRDVILQQAEYTQIKNLGISTLYLDTYATVNSAGSRYLDGDNCIYMNHSTDPNVVFIDRFGIAKRDIPEGSELTCDYRTITTPEHFKELL